MNKLSYGAAGFAFFFATMPQAKSLGPLTGRLAKIKHHINRANLGWQAKLPPLSEHYLSSLGTSIDMATIAKPATDSTDPGKDSQELDETHFPSHLDWRNMNGTNYVSPVQDQGQCGSCVSFASLTTLETQLNIAGQAPQMPWQFSRQYFFSCGGGQCRGGMKMSQAVSFLAEHGVADTGCMAYTSGRGGEDVSCKMACANATERLEKIVNYTRPTRGFVDVPAIKRALLQGPLLSSLILYEDFLVYKSGVYRHSFGRQRGSHAFVIVGWDDTKQAWIGRNSMGRAWGEAGDFYIAWDDKDSLPGRYTYQFQVNTHNGFIALTNHQHSKAFSGITRLQFESRFPHTYNITWYLSKDRADLDGSHALFHKELSRPPFHSEESWQVQDQLDTTAYPNGPYYMILRAEHAQGSSYAQPIPITIQNPL